MRIVTLNKENEKKWDEFVKLHPVGRFSQTIAFKKVVENTYFYKSLYFFLEKERDIIAVFPLFEWRDMFCKYHLSSVPFTDYGGPLSLELTNQEAEMFVQHLKKILLESRASYVMINSGLNLPMLKNLKKFFIKKDNDKRAVLRLDEPDILWQKVFDRNVKKCIKAAYRNNLESEMVATSKAIEKYFYPLYLLAMKRFGTPPHSIDYFLNKIKYFGDSIKLFFIKDGHKRIASLMGFAIGETVQITKIASDSRYWHKRPNDLVHWELIKWAAENNYKYLDFGPVRYDNQAKYKIKWGAKLYDNYTYYFANDLNFLLRRKRLEPVLKVKYFSKFWSFLPCGLSKKAGPIIRKNLGR